MARWSCQTEDGECHPPPHTPPWTQVCREGDGGAERQRERGPFTPAGSGDHSCTECSSLNLLTHPLHPVSGGWLDHVSVIHYEPAPTLIVPSRFPPRVLFHVGSGAHVIV